MVWRKVLPVFPLKAFRRWHVFPQAYRDEQCVCCDMALLGRPFFSTISMSEAVRRLRKVSSWCHVHKLEKGTSSFGLTGFLELVSSRGAATFCQLCCDAVRSCSRAKLMSLPVEQIKARFPKRDFGDSSTPLSIQNPMAPMEIRGTGGKASHAVRWRPDRPARRGAPQSVPQAEEAEAKARQEDAPTTADSKVCTITVKTSSTCHSLGLSADDRKKRATQTFLAVRYSSH